MKSWKIKNSMLAIITIIAMSLPIKAKAGAIYSYLVGLSTEVTQIVNSTELFGINIAQWIEVGQQVEQLYNEAEMIAHQLTNLESLGWVDLLPINTLQDVADVLESGDVLSYTAANIDRQFMSKYPTYRNYRWGTNRASDMQRKYQDWSMQNANNVKTTLEAAGVQHETILDEEYRLNEIEWKSLAAEGNLEVNQAANLIAAEEVRSLQRLRELVAINSQMHANYMANEQDKEDFTQSVWQTSVGTESNASIIDGTDMGNLRFRPYRPPTP